MRHLALALMLACVACDARGPAEPHETRWLLTYQRTSGFVADAAPVVIVQPSTGAQALAVADAEVLPHAPGNTGTFRLTVVDWNGVGWRGGANVVMVPGGSFGIVRSFEPE